MYRDSIAKRDKEIKDMTLESLVNDIVTAAMDNPGIDLIWYKTAMSDLAVVLGIVMGILGVVSTILIPIIIAMELMTLNIPILSYYCKEYERKLQESGVDKVRVNAGLVLNGAIRAIRMNIETGRNVNLCYLRVRVGAFIWVSVMTVVVLAGTEFAVGLLLRLVAPIVQRLAII